MTLNRNPNIPAVVEDRLDAVQFFEDGKLLLGSSNLTGRYWNGSLICFQNVEDAPDIEKCYTGIEIQYGVSDLICLNNKRAAIGLDSGAVEIYQLNEETESNPILNVLSTSYEHDSSVSSLSSTCDGTKLASGGFDKCVKIWDLQSFASIATYRPISSGMVLQVSCSKTDPNILLACTQDGKLLLLDLRLPKPATSLSNIQLESSPSAVAWKPESNTIFAVGDISGCINVRDIRNVGSVFQYNGHSRTIYRLVFSPSKSNWLASCSDNSDIIVTDTQGSIYENSNTLYKDNRHNDFIRGLTWSPENDVITCGWDKKVYRHLIVTPNTLQMEETSVNAVNGSTEH